ncbi:MAG: hypothetical protein JNL32_05035 [Candidatus Kapabacteria bacterium]|nr:hypothetical protein [Candidatus Kapabacteria bacterium]
MKHVLRICSICFVLIAVVCANQFIVEAQTWSQGRGSFSETGTTGSSSRQKNVLKELKLSQAQIEEIRTLTGGFASTVLMLKKKSDALKEDLRNLQLQENPSDAEITRLLKESALTQAEINSKALPVMASIKQLLTTTQRTKLNELRKQEQERLEAERKQNSDGRASSPRSSLNMVRSFSFSSSGSSSASTFDKTAVFSYPDVELWIDDANGNGFSSFSIGGDDMQSMFNFGPDNDGTFNFSFPDDMMNRFNFPQRRNDNGSKNAAPNTNESNEELRQQLNELNSRLRKLEEEKKKRREE